MGIYWRVRLLGRLEAVSDDERIGRFRTRRVGLMLAHLAYSAGRSYPREELADLLWPEADKETGKTNLRQALSSLRKHLEPPGVLVGTVLESDRFFVRLRPEAVECDVVEFRRRLDAAQGREPSVEQLTQALDLYEGDLLPGFYEEWVLRERLHLEDLYIAALKRRALLEKEEGDFASAARDLRLALARDPLCEGTREEMEQVREGLRQAYRGSTADALAKGIPLKLATDRHPPQTPSRTDAPIARIPYQPTRFFGRQEELSVAVAAFTEGATRLLSIVGPSGIGKTRLSVEIARTMAERGWSVTFVPLVDLSEGRHLLNAVLSALKIDSSEEEALDLIAGGLEGDRNLLVLDNMEHLLESAVLLAGALLARIPNVAILATSQQALKVGGERELTLDPLPIPSAVALDALDLEVLGRIPSIALFVDRAKGPLADFRLTARNASAIGGICSRLEGLPLSLEIAAGLTGVFSPAQILQNLDNQLALLKSRRRDLNPRHRSLRAAIESGYGLLSEKHQRLFLDLSVFQDGFGAATARAVSAPDRSTAEVLDLLLDLRERSLLQTVPVKESETRFRLLESYREFAVERLDAANVRDLRLRHARHFLRLAEEGAIGPEDRSNRAAALRTFYEEGAVPECVALMHSYGRFPRIDEEIVEGLARHPNFETFDPIDQVRALGFLDVLQYQRSEFEPALETCRRGCELAERYGLEAERARCAYRYVRALRMLGHNEEVVALARRNLEDAIRTGDHLVVEAASATLGSAHWALGNLDQARDVLKGACDASRHRRNGSADWLSLYNLALIEIDSGRLDEGRGLAEEVRQEAGSIEDELGLLSADVLFCRIELIGGDPQRALRSSHEILARRRRIGMTYLTLQAIAFHADVLATLERFYDAAVLLGASRRSGLHYEREATARADKARSGLRSEAFDRAWNQGCRMTLDQAYRYAVQFREVESRAFEPVHDL